ncbi:MAG: hypothetical protein IID46_04295, partial [Planctomycetes bacterium]|nr:hypothetical protein [Planctomycetota bacterium]
MIRRIKKFTLMGLCLLVVLTAAPVPSQAGIVTDAWYALFSPPGSPWFPGLTRGYYTANYYPGAGNYSGYRAYRPFGYSPFTYRSSQAFYAPCTPCGVIGGPCGVGNCASNCAVNYAPQTARIEPTPQKNGDLPKTYSKDDNSESGTEAPSPESEDSNFEQKQNEKGFGPTRKSETENSEEVQFGEFQKPIQVEARKVPAESESSKSVIQLRKPAPPQLPEEDDDKDSPTGKSGSETEESHIAPLNRDHKLVGHSLPNR